MRILAFIVVSFFWLTGVAQSQQLANGVSLTVMPLVLDIKPPKVADNIMVRNSSRMAVRLQVRVFRWQQKGGKDYYAPTNDVIVMPPFVSMKPGGVSTVRVTRIVKAPVLAQESYRVFVDQIPPSSLRTNTSDQSSAGVSMVLRQVVPVFFSPGTGGGTGQQAGGITFALQRAKGGINIIAKNNGKNRVRMSDVILMAGGQVIGSQSKLVGYVLPNSQFSFFIQTQGGGMPDKIRFLSDAGEVEYSLR